jgi:hypothetical protein
VGRESKFSMELVSKSMIIERKKNKDEKYNTFLRPLELRFL